MVLQVNPMFGGNNKSVYISNFFETAQDVTGFSELTTENVDIGPPHPSRIVVVASVYASGASATITNCQLGAITGTKRAGFSTSDFFQTDFYSANIPTGETLNITHTRNTTTNAWTIRMMTLSFYGFDGVDWSGGQDRDPTNTSEKTMSADIVIPQGGVVFGVYSGRNIQKTASRVWSIADQPIHEHILDPDTSATAVSGDIQVRYSLALNKNLPSGSTTVSWSSSDSVVRRPSFAALAFR